MMDWGEWLRRSVNSTERLGDVAMGEWIVYRELSVSLSSPLNIVVAETRFR
jgi:hypothetical protein